MTTRYRCPLSTCRWFHDSEMTPPPAYCPPDILAWSGPTWASMSERIDGGLATAHIIDAHLVTHSPFQWMTELRDERQRTESVTAERDRLRIVVEKLAFLTDAVDPLSTRRLSSRAEVEAMRELLAATQIISPQPLEPAS